jgi:hypothetical protein
MVPKSYLVIAVSCALVFLALLVKVEFFPPADEKDPYVMQIREMEQTIDRQERLIGLLKKQNRAVQENHTKMSHLRDIDQESLSKLQQQLKADQNERLKIEEELAFLRGMVSSKLGKGVLHIQRLRLQPGESENQFSYAFTVSKVLRNSEYLNGFVYISISGKLDGSKRALPLEQVSEEKTGKIKMRFKHFQNIEGKLLLPSGFKPSGVTIEVKPEGDEFKSIKKSYKWVLTN